MMKASVILVLISATIGALSAAPPAGAGDATRGPWLLASLPDMGRLSWACDGSQRGYRTYVLRFDPSASSATETVTLRASRRVIFSRRINPPWHVLVLPRSSSAVRRLTVSQPTEPGTLRAIVTLDFKGTINLPSHCAAYLPPAMTVKIIPR